MLPDGNLFAYLVTALLGGGLFKGIEAVIRAFSDTKKDRVVSDALGMKTPAEIESMAVATMRSALESAQNRIDSLEEERETDKKYYQDRIAELLERVERLTGELNETDRIVRELKTQLQT